MEFKLKTSNKISMESNLTQIKPLTIPKANIMMPDLNQLQKSKKINISIACFQRKDKASCPNMKPKQNQVLEKHLHLMSKVKNTRIMKIDLQAPKLHQITFDFMNYLILFYKFHKR